VPSASDHVSRAETSGRRLCLTRAASGRSQGVDAEVVTRSAA
jgi:hypothetical protein